MFEGHDRACSTPSSNDILGKFGIHVLNYIAISISNLMREKFPEVAKIHSKVEKKYRPFDLFSICFLRDGITSMICEGPNSWK